MKNGNCRCEGCRQMFYSMTAFDMHKAGSYTGRGSRRCLTQRDVGEGHAALDKRCLE